MKRNWRLKQIFDANIDHLKRVVTANDSVKNIIYNVSITSTSKHMPR